MTRFLVASVLLAVLSAGVHGAEDYTGKIKDLDTKKNEITITVDDKDMTFAIAKDVSVFFEKKPMKKMPGGLEPLPGGLSGLKTGNMVTITTEKKDAKEIASLIKLENAPLPDKKK
jgi:hypothetical protein